MIRQPGFKNIYNAKFPLWETENRNNGQAIYDNRPLIYNLFKK